MDKKYVKPTVKDLSGVQMAVGSCASGHGVPEKCTGGSSDGYSCIAGDSHTGTPPLTCVTNGLYATDCAFGQYAG